MTNRTRLVSGRVVTSNSANVPADRYQYLDLSSAEPNLGTANVGDVLIYDTGSPGARKWIPQASISGSVGQLAFDKANAAYNQANVTIGVDASQNARMTIIEATDVSQNVRLDYSNTAITIIQGVDVGQNARITIIEATDVSQNVRLAFSNTRMDISDGVNASQNVRLAFSNTRMDINDGVNASQNVRLDYSNTAITIIQGVDVGQNSRMTIIEGVDATQNTNISNKVNLTGSLNQTISGNVTIGQDLVVSGNLTITGNIASQNVQQLAVADPLILLGLGNYTSDTKDIGFAAHYNDGTNAHAGLIRDFVTKEFYVFQGYTPEIDASNNVDINNATFQLSKLNASEFHGNVIANTVVVNGVNLSSYSQAAYAQANVTIGVDATQNTRLTVIENTDLSQNVRLDYSNTAITIIQGIDLTQNTAIAATDGKMNSAYAKANNALANTTGTFAGTLTVTGNVIANSFITSGSSGNITGVNFVYANTFVASNAYIFPDGTVQTTAASASLASGAYNQANTATVLAQAAYNQANVTIGVDATQNTRLTVIENTDLSQNVRLDYSNTAITIIQGTDTSQNARMLVIEGTDTIQNARMTIIEGVDVGQNTNISAATALAQAAFNRANTEPDSANYLANTIIVANSTGYLSNSNSFYTSSNNTFIATGNLKVLGSVTANNYIGTGSGVATVNSASNLDLSSPVSVRIVGGGTFRLPSLSSSQINSLIASNGDACAVTSSINLV